MRPSHSRTLGFINVGTKVEQSTDQRLARGPEKWTERADSSLPVPFRPESGLVVMGQTSR